MVPLFQRTFPDAAAPKWSISNNRHIRGGTMPLRMRVHDREPIGAALRRFKKLVERSGIQKEVRKRAHYEKPCETRRRAESRKRKSITKPRPKGRET
jgi:small subunit ribosomal protein S21